MPTICYKHFRGAVSAPAGNYGRVQWVLARPLFRYARFDLASVPKAQRRQALELQIRQWLPSTSPGWYLVWDGDTAQIWAWDADLIDAAIRAQNLRPENITIVPETLLRQQSKEGCILSPCLEGCEGQVWRDGTLAASRWWPQIPEAGEWRNFLRDAGRPLQPGDAAPPALQTETWLVRPWAVSVASKLATPMPGAVERWWITLITLGLAGAIFWPAAQILKLNAAMAERNDELAVLNKNSTVVLEARRQALEAIDHIKQLQALSSYPSQLALLAKVADSLPKNGAYLREWDFQNGKLKFQIASPNKLAGSDIIKQIQSTGIFDSVLTTAGSEANNLALTMDVRPQSVVTFATDAAPALPKKDGDKLPVLVPPLR